MREQLKKLAGVQELDTRIGALRRRIGALDDGSLLAGKIEAAKARAERLKSVREERLKAQRQAEEEVLRVQQRLDREKHRLETGDVSGHRDVMDLQQHVRSLSQHLLSIDEKLHGLTKETTAADAEVRKLEETIERAERKLAQLRRRHRQDAERLQAEVEQIEAERQQRVAEVSPALLSQYDAIRVRTEDNCALVVLQEPICSACGTAIPTLMFDRLLLSDVMTHCENCGRILIRPSE